MPFRGAVDAAAAAPAAATTQTNPFTMPHVYASALERKVQAVEDMRRGVKVSTRSLLSHPHPIIHPEATTNPNPGHSCP